MLDLLSRADGHLSSSLDVVVGVRILTAHAAIINSVGLVVHLVARHTGLLHLRQFQRALDSELAISRLRHPRVSATVALSVSVRVVHVSMCIH